MKGLLSVWRSPAFWLLGQAVVLFLLAATLWRPETRRYSPDSFEYTTLLTSRGTATALLASRRTLGYPVLLEVARRLPGGLESIPYFHLALYLGAVVGFGLAAGAYLGSAVRGAIAASPLFYARLVYDHAPDLLADVPAAALALATLALLLWLVVRPRSAALWLGVGLATFFTYQVRPAYLFLVPLVPAVGFLLTWLADQRRGWRSVLRRPAAGLAVLTLAPFLLFSTLRWAATGHFGLVSFGGMNLIGIASSMLTPKVVPKLPEATRPLAGAILQRRLLKEMEVRLVYDYEQWVERYNRNISGMAIKAAARMPALSKLNRRQLWVEINRRSTELAFALIRQYPTLYARWLRDALVSAFARMAEGTAVRLAALAAAGSWALAALARRRDRALSPVSSAGRHHVGLGVALGLALAAVAYAAASIFLVVLVEPPIDRYVFAAELLLPSGFLALALALWPRPAEAPA